ncbi:hypothetical protein Ddye_013463 [Dipteronia dyeriana]|uniref:RNase H type-1 domain-containing protein n=1 Tax=Dipteronia dyeriana TaxID=168575 RepID=A0AAE0CJM0_9ROSI|nr:hypothetical protein Ddye_013463 [Dipteronia dyeriana]
MIQFSWTPLARDVLKFNVDGSTRGAPRAAGMRGVLWTSSGRVMCLFSKHLGHRESNTAGIMVIHKATDIVATNPVFQGRKIIIGSDSKVVVSWVNNNSFESINNVKLIYDIRNNLTKLGNMEVIYNARATNSFADILAKRGSNMEGDLFVCGDL